MSGRGVGESETTDGTRRQAGPAARPSTTSGRLPRAGGARGLPAPSTWVAPRRRGRPLLGLAGVVALAVALACGGGGPAPDPSPSWTVERPASPVEGPAATDQDPADDTGVEASRLGDAPRTRFTYAATGHRAASIDEVRARALAVEGYWTLVVEPSRWRASDTGEPALLRRDGSEGPDGRLGDRLTAVIVALAKSRLRLTRHEAVRDDYARVLGEARARGLPDVVAGIPMVMSRYQADLQLPDCGLGWWGLLPDEVVRASHAGGHPVVVQDCRLEGRGGSPSTFTPTAAGASSTRDAAPAYVDVTKRDDDPARCRIVGCAVDDRRDVEKSTAVAFERLSAAWDDAEFAASGAAVPLMLMAYVEGHDRPRGGVGRPGGMRSAYDAYRRARPPADRARYVEEALPCAGSPGGPGCAGAPTAASVAFVVDVLASHLLAVCLYGRVVDAEHEVFLPYEPFAAAHCGAYGARTVTRTEGRSRAPTSPADGAPATPR